MKAYIFLIMPLFFLAARCADESEENQFYKNERLNEYVYDEHPITKKVAMEQWEVFLQESQDLIFYSRNNLESLRYQMDEATGPEKLELRRQYESAKKAIDKLELEKQQRNDTFSAELNQYDAKSERRNAAFIKQFKREIIRINVALGCSAAEQQEMFPQ